VAGQNGDREKGHLVETATDICGQNGDRYLVAKTATDIYWSKRRHVNESYIYILYII
jgi:hypothetical protein